MLEPGRAGRDEGRRDAGFVVRDSAVMRAREILALRTPELRVLVYEVEHDGLPALCKRHLPGLEALLRD